MTSDCDPEVEAALTKLESIAPLSLEKKEELRKFSKEKIKELMVENRILKELKQELAEDDPPVPVNEAAKKAVKGSTVKAVKGEFVDASGKPIPAKEPEDSGKKVGDEPAEKVDPTDQALAILQNGVIEEMRGAVKTIVDGIKKDLADERISVWMVGVRDDGDTSWHPYPNADNLAKTLEPGGVRERWPDRVRRIVDDLTPSDERTAIAKLTELAALAKQRREQLPEKPEPVSVKEGSESKPKEVKD